MQLKQALSSSVSQGRPSFDDTSSPQMAKEGNTTPNTPTKGFVTLISGKVKSADSQVF